MLCMLAGWALVRKAENSQEVELVANTIEETVAPLEYEAPTTEKLESRTGKAASQRVSAGMMSWSGCQSTSKETVQITLGLARDL